MRTRLIVVLVGITVGTIHATSQDPTPNQLPVLRWVFFFGFLAATVAAVMYES